MTEPAAAPGQELQALRLLLARLGVNPEELLTQAPQPVAIPTFDEYIARVSVAVPEGSRRLYTTYWRTISTVWAADGSASPPRSRSNSSPNA